MHDPVRSTALALAAASLDCQGRGGSFPPWPHDLGSPVDTTHWSSVWAVSDDGTGRVASYGVRMGTSNEHPRAGLDLVDALLELPTSASTSTCHPNPRSRGFCSRWGFASIWNVNAVIISIDLQQLIGGLCASPYCFINLEFVIILLHFP